MVSYQPINNGECRQANSDVGNIDIFVLSHLSISIHIAHAMIILQKICSHQIVTPNVNVLLCNSNLRNVPSASTVDVSGVPSHS